MPVTDAHSWFTWALLSACFAALTALFAVVFLGECPSAREWLGISLVGAGVAVLGMK